MRRRRRVVVGDHGEPARERLHGHVAVGFGQAGKQEDIARSVVRGEVLAAPRPGEDRLGTACLQFAPVRTVAHQHQPGARRAPARLRESGKQRVQILFRREAAHVQQHRVVRRRTPARAQFLAAPRRIEQPGIHAARDHAQAVETERGQLGAHGFGGHHGAQAAVVELAQVGEDRLAQPADAVVAAVGVEIGAEIGNRRDPELERGAQGGPAQRTLGDDVHDVGTAVGPELLQRALRGQAHLQVRVARDRHTAHQHFLVVTVCAGAIGAVRRSALGALLPGADQLDLVVALAQPFDEARRGQRHAVDLRRVGFGHHRDAQRAAHAVQLLDLDRCRVVAHGANHARLPRRFHDGCVKEPRRPGVTRLSSLLYGTVAIAPYSGPGCRVSVLTTGETG